MKPTTLHMLPPELKCSKTITQKLVIVKRTYKKYCNSLQVESETNGYNTFAIDV